MTGCAVAASLRTFAAALVAGTAAAIGTSACSDSDDVSSPTAGATVVVEAEAGAAAAGAVAAS